MKGRKPKPTAFRLIEGNREHRTIHAELEPKPKSCAPPCPKILGLDAKKHWKYIVKHLAAMNTLGASDQAQIMSASLAYGQASELQREIERILADINLLWDPTTNDALGIDFAKLTISKGKQLDNKRRLLNNTLAAMSRFEADLGLNPTARTRIKLDKPQVQNKRERLLG